ncbi:MAG: hypothetical protein M1580_00290 [Candidatus Parvarchaeota archaeon]|nr:hypothetical protein [Candidatus Parvarchaeota archaeon]
MKNRNLNRILKDNIEYKRFLFEKFGINEELELVKNILPYYINSMAYSVGYNKIWISNEARRIMYIIAEKDELKELREGCKFIIRHEIGHSHDVKDKNKNVRDYFHRLLYINSGNYVVDGFPESEATRYALSKSNNYIEALAGFSAISSFLYKTDVKTSIETYSEHFSNSNVKEEKRMVLNSFSSFKLSNENYGKILEKAKTYLDKLNENLARSLLYKLKDKKAEKKE